MIVPRGRLARCSPRGDALFCLAGRKFAPAKIAMSPGVVEVSKIRLCDPHHIIVDATAILLLHPLLVSLSIMMHLFQPSTQKMISYYYLD